MELNQLLERLFSSNMFWDFFQIQTLFPSGGSLTFHGLIRIHMNLHRSSTRRENLRCLSASCFSSTAVGLNNFGTLYSDYVGFLSKPFLLLNSLIVIDMEWAKEPEERTKCCISWRTWPSEFQTCRFAELLQTHIAQCSWKRCYRKASSSSCVEPMMEPCLERLTTCETSISYYLYEPVTANNTFHLS